MKKVLIFTPRVSGQRANYYNALSKLCDLTVISELDTPNNILKDFNIDKHFNHIVMSGPKLKINSYQALCFGYKKYFKHNKYDKIIIEQVFTPTAFLIMRYLKRKGINFFGSADGGIVKYKENRIKFFIKKYLISLPSYWITSGKGGYSYLNHYGVKNECIFKFMFSPYNSMDLPKIIIDENEKEYIKNKLGIKEKNIILLVGRPDDDKGYDILLKATNNFNKDIGIYIAGGPPTTLCKKILNTQGRLIDSNVHYIGLLNKDKLKELYAISDIFVFPTRHDVWGYPVQEAMSFGVPIISSDASNAAIELVENNINGFIFKNEDFNELRNKLLLLINNKSLREKISENNYNKSKLYTSENMAKSIYNIICKVR